MAGATVRITESTHKLLKQMAKQAGKPMQLVLDEALEEHRRTCFLNEMNAAYSVLKADPQAWEEEQRERILWEAASADAQDDEG